MTHNTNIKIMKTKPTLTDEEIRSHMDFDKLLQVHKAGVGSVNGSITWFKIAGYTAPVVLVIAALVYSLWPSDTVGPENQPTAVVQIDSIKADDSEIELLTEEVKPNLTPRQKVESAKNQSQPLQKSEQPTVPTFTQAEPVDGYPELYSYFSHELKYPTVALKDSLEGVVSVSFTINEQGKPTDVKITNSLGELFDLECRRVIESMPAWKAATVNGSPISTRMSIPLTFRITKN